MWIDFKLLSQSLVLETKSVQVLHFVGVSAALLLNIKNSFVWSREIRPGDRRLLF